MLAYFGVDMKTKTYNELIWSLSRNADVYEYP